jgi:pyridoxal phosphate enzyme (YggS family)
MHTSVYNLEKIKKEINNPKISIIAVSKTFGVDKILPLLHYGHLNFGENKIQEAEKKWSKIKSQFPLVKLHMIGKLQTNKVKHAVKLFDFIHSVDNLKLANKIKSEQEKIDRKIKIFIQVNIGNENQKNGILETELNDFYNHISRDLNLDVVGLMCIPPLNNQPEKYFRIIKQLNKKFNFHNLSMGMSSDYLTAIKFGATHIRVGTKIFGIRDKTS